MTKLSHLLLALVFITGPWTAFAQIKNSRTTSVSIEALPQDQARVESLVYKKNTAVLLWNAQTQQGQITYDSKKTSAAALLKELAYAGYSNSAYLAPYSQQVAAPAQSPEHGGVRSALDAVYDNYFKLQQQLVASDLEQAKRFAQEILAARTLLILENLSASEQKVWKAQSAVFNKNLDALIAATNLDEQREVFSDFSIAVAALAQASELAYPIYLNQCPMYQSGEKSQWLSRESGIKNPYYGSKMLNCGSLLKQLN